MVWPLLFFKELVFRKYFLKIIVARFCLPEFKAVQNWPFQNNLLFQNKLTVLARTNIYIEYHCVSKLKIQL